MAEMVKIVYHGPPASHPVGGVATGQDYGHHVDGDTFFVWTEDQQANPDTFALANEAPAAEKPVKRGKRAASQGDTAAGDNAAPAPNSPQEQGASKSGKPVDTAL